MRIHPQIRVFFLLSPLLALQPLRAQVQTLYSHGNPTVGEQYMLELINRARANPSAEGNRLATTKDGDVKFAIDFFNVDLAKLKKEFDSYPERPPLAMNAKLLTAARRHSTDMARKNFQSHTGSDGSNELDRLRDAGYEISAFNESIYSNLVPSVFYAHCGLNIDWGNGPGGTQPGLGHRMNVMNFGRLVFREVGIGISARSGASAEKYGKLAVTQDHGISQDSPSFLVGVAYYDVNRNGICDPGEGLSGIEVRPDTGDRYAKTSGSGGYAIPVPSFTGPAMLTLSGGGLETVVNRAFQVDTENVKVDLRITSGGSFLHTEAVDTSATEGGKGAAGKAVFRVARVGPTGQDLAVRITRPVRGVMGDALPPDYKISVVKPARLSGVGNPTGEFTVVISKGQRAATVRITAVRDFANEPDERVVFRIVDQPAYRLAIPSTTTISIKD